MAKIKATIQFDNPKSTLEINFETTDQTFWNIIMSQIISGKSKA